MLRFIRGLLRFEKADVVSQKRAHDVVGRFALPPEIVLHITAHLTRPSLLAFALTCWPFYSLCFPQSPGLNQAEKEELLQFLEKDVANLYFCHDCTMLHEWRTLQKWPRTDSSACSFISKPRVYSHFCGCGNFILNQEARVAMNRHFYGPEHGIPLRQLERKVTSSHVYGVDVYSGWKARVVDDQLMLSFVLTQSHQRGDVQALRDYVDKHIWRVCRHLVTNSRYPSSFREKIHELAEGRPDRFVSCKQAVRSCTACLTDYSISICWQGTEKGWLIELVTYHQLGDCRSPHDWIWCVMADDDCDKRPRASQPKKYPPGIVKHRWSKSDGVIPELEGEWVGDPARSAELIRQCARFG
ncbi:hypothetical protein GQ53DRAFT_861755 [Thozetella sp. PMI_491]|nr:hypothetical protein GQ53DRAFT_861755 [Thozetella sp. PMI_491]